MTDYRLEFFQHQPRFVGKDIKFHEHSCWELVYYEKGSGNLLMEGQTLSFSSGMYSLIAPGVAHEENYRQDCTVLFIGFTGSEHLPPPGLYSDRDGQILRWMRRIVEEARQQPQLHGEMESLLLGALAIALYRETAAPAGPRSSTYAAAYLRENFNQPVSMRALAAICGWSYDHFQHVFRREIGLSPQQYLIRQRLSRSAEMLREGSSCTDAAYACGFSSAAQFSTMFRRAYGVAPRDFAQGKEPENESALIMDNVE